MEKKIKKSAISGEFIIEIDQNNHVAVYRIYDNVKQSIREMYEIKGLEIDPNLTQRQLAADLMKACDCKDEVRIGDYTLTKRDNGSYETFRDYGKGNVKAALREVAQKVGFEVNPDWTNQQLGNKLLDFINNKPQSVYIMQELKLNGRMTVSALKDDFKTQTGGTLRVKDGNKKADESATLASIRKDSDNKNGVLELNPEMTVGDFKAKMLSDFGLKVEVGTPDDWVSVPDGITLGQLRELPKNATKAQLDALVEGKASIESDNAVKETSETTHNDDYPTYKECCAKFKPNKKANRVKYSDDGKTLEEVNATFEGPLIIPEGVETLKDCNSNKVTAIVMPDSVTKIERGFCWRSWYNLEFVRWSRGLTEIPANTFQRTLIHEWQFPEGLKIIGRSCFEGMRDETYRIKRVTLPSTLEYILSDAFQNNALEEIVIPANVKAIFPGAFSMNEKLKEVKFMSDETVVLEGAFADCPLIDAEAICKAHQLGDRVLGADEVRYEDNVLTYLPFYYCGKLTVKDGTQRIDRDIDNRFPIYDGITELYLPDSLGNCYLHFPKNVKALRVPNETTRLGMRDMPKLRLFNWPKKVNEIAFSSLEAIESIEIPDSVTTIEISYLSQLKSISIPNSVTKIKGVSNLPLVDKVEIPDSVTEIENGSFCNLPLVTSIKIPSKIERIEDDSFCDTGIKQLELPAGLKEIGDGAFRNNTSLEEVTIPANVEAIGADAFSGCTSLKKITFEGNPSIKNSTFKDCPGYNAPKLELPTVEKDENGRPIVKLHFYTWYVRGEEGSLPDEIMEGDSYGGIFAISRSADPENYPFDDLAWLCDDTDSPYESFSVFEHKNETAAQTALRHSFMLWADFNDSYDDDVMRNATNGLALCVGDPKYGDVKGEDYTGPEAIFDLTFGDDEENPDLHLRYHIFKNEESSKWKAEEIDNAE